MKKSILAAAILAFNSMSALAVEYKLLEYPSLEKYSSHEDFAFWKEKVVECFEQANKWRMRGEDTAPVFVDVSGKTLAGINAMVIQIPPDFTTNIDPLKPGVPAFCFVPKGRELVRMKFKPYFHP